MALFDCPECAGPVSSSAACCPKCGWRRPPPKKKRPLLWLSLALAGGFLLFTFKVSGDPAAQKRSQDRAAIDLCWQEQSRKSNSAATGGFVAEACEAMERRYEEVHGVKP